MDLDETLLDNSGYQRRLEASGQGHTQEAWELWVAERKAGLVPGAKEFIAKLRKLPNGRIIFISNRYARNTDHSRANVNQLGLGAKSDIYLLHKDRNDRKDLRRAEVLQGKGRIKSYGAEGAGMVRRRRTRFSDDSKLKWGTHKFMLLTRFTAIGRAIDLISLFLYRTSSRNILYSRGCAFPGSSALYPNSSAVKGLTPLLP